MSSSPWVKWYAGDFLNGIADLDPNQIAVYSVVLNLIYDIEGPIIDDLERIARRCNMRPTTCAKVVGALVEMGKLTRCDGVIGNHRCEKEIESRSNLSQKYAENSQKRWGNRVGKPNENNKPHIPSDMPNASDGNPYQKPDTRIKKEEPPNPLEAEFAEFYAAYPRAMDRKAAERAYRIARKSATHGQIMHGLVAYVAEKRGSDPKFIKLPATWLNAAAWENHPPDVARPEYSDDLWETFLLGWAEGKPWAATLRGPPPDEPLCAVPGRLLDRYRSRFGDLKPCHLELVV